MLEVGEETKETPDFAPEPGDVPQPFSLTLANTSPASNVDWLAAVVDKRVLRGGRRLGCAPGPALSTWSSSSTSSASTCGPCPLPSSSSSHGLSTSGMSSSLDPVAPSSSSSLPSSHGLGHEHDAVTADSPEEGITPVQRPGRDRWHNLDGSIKRNSLQPVPEEDPAANEVPFQVVDVCRGVEETTIKAVTFYGETFGVRASPGAPPSMGDEASTTAGEEGRDDAASSSNASSTPVTPGFWRHGVWVDRPRTPEEHRRHVGGGGMKRLLKREARLAAYFKGDWKPRWLRDYIDQKAKREQVLVAEEGELESGELLDDADNESSNTVSSPWAELGWWSQEEWQQWWNWNGVKNDTQGSPSSTWSSSSTSTSTTSWASSWATSWVDLTTPEASSSDRPVWLSSLSLSSVWEELSWFAQIGEGDFVSTTSTTSSSFPPNYGLFPVVSPAPPLTDLRMELSNAETAVLQEAAVPQQTLARLQGMMECLIVIKRRGEVLRRAGLWVASFADSTKGRRRLMPSWVSSLAASFPRGYLPVRRYPSAEGQRWHVYNWARNYCSDLVFVVERHLQTGLTPDDQHVPSEGDHSRPLRSRSPQSVVASEAQASTPREAVSITDDEEVACASSGSSTEEPASSQSLTSDWALDEHGVRVRVLPASPGDAPRGPPPPEPVHAPAGDAPAGDDAASSGGVNALSAEGEGSLARALRGELLGIWSERPQMASEESMRPASPVPAGDSLPSVPALANDVDAATSVPALANDVDAATSGPSTTSTSLENARRHACDDSAEVLHEDH